MPSFVTLVSAAVLGLAGLSAAIPSIEAVGAKLFLNPGGSQFFIKGIAYQLTNDDPLANAAQCELDVALMKTIGTNSIRVYHVDAAANHDGCMAAFAQAGIYTWIDLDTFSTYIIGPTPYWTKGQFNAYAAVMDAFANYSNVAGFFVGNEVLNGGSDSPAAPYVKAAIRDMKAYRDSKGYRNIPVGYSGADIPSLRPNLQNYMACGSSDADRADFFSLNAYEWCGPAATFQTSGYEALEMNASNYNIPLFFSETGCNTVKPRTFSDQAAILGPDMDENWSGAIIYEWIEETNDYGLISYGPPAAATATASNVVAGFTRGGTPTPISSDWDNLSAQWATLSPSGVQSAAYKPSNSPPVCPPYTSGDWMVSGDVPLPTMGAALLSGAAATMNVAAPTTTTSGGSSTVGSGGAKAGTTGSTTTTGGASVTSAAASSSKSSGVASSDRVTTGYIFGAVGSMLAWVTLL